MTCISCVAEWYCIAVDFPCNVFNFNSAILDSSEEDISLWADVWYYLSCLSFVMAICCYEWVCAKTSLFFFAIVMIVMIVENDGMNREVTSSRDF